jgi:hypothetical protein
MNFRCPISNFQFSVPIADLGRLVLLNWQLEIENRKFCL